ncbi:MAG: DUF4258 domain-containing protein [Candidatus Omnitrophica bacterium]|nr:DUF4258 domain-containing protein [Candidatus Omnitrophota bacterium]
MKTLDQIRHQLAAGEFELSRHALKRVVERNIRSDEVREAGAMAEEIERYPDDKYSPSVLLLGFAGTGRPIHLQVSLSETEEIKIITIYEPDPREWIDFRSRR